MSPAHSSVLVGASELYGVRGSAIRATWGHSLPGLQASSLVSDFETTCALGIENQERERQRVARRAFEIGAARACGVWQAERWREKASGYESHNQPAVNHTHNQRLL